MVLGLQDFNLHFLQTRIPVNPDLATIIPVIFLQYFFEPSPPAL